MWIMFLFCLLATIGLTHLIVDSTILETPRVWLKEHYPKIGQLVRCYQCAGFWAGLTVGLITYGWEWRLLLLCAFTGSFLGPFGDALLDWQVSINKD